MGETRAGGGERRMEDWGLWEAMSLAWYTGLHGGRVLSEWEVKFPKSPLPNLQHHLCHPV